MEDGDTRFDFEGHPKRRSEDRIPSAYKLWLQKAIDEMRPSPQMIDEIKNAVTEANEVLIHKINNKIMESVGECRIEHEQFKGEIQAEIKAMHASASTLKWVCGIGAVLIAGSFTLISIFKG